MCVLRQDSATRSGAACLFCVCALRVWRNTVHGDLHAALSSFIGI